MFLTSVTWARSNGCFPRARGDVPTTDIRRTSLTTFSPHTRGCSYEAAKLEYDQAVFPAYAGMFRSNTIASHDVTRFPRIRGDVPCFNRSQSSVRVFSPHTRGCSHVADEAGDIANVFPAYAGMFRGPRPAPRCGPRFPRIRGDVPLVRIIE